VDLDRPAHASLSSGAREKRSIYVTHSDGGFEFRVWAACEKKIGCGAIYERARSRPRSQVNLSERKHAPGPIEPRLQTASEAGQISPSWHPETFGLKQPPDAVAPAAQRISPSGQLLDARAPDPINVVIKKHSAQ
jgi:hypothetical protein